MRNLLGLGLIVLGTTTLVHAEFKRRAKRRPVDPANAVRPQFQAMGEIMRPIILFCIAVVAAKMSFFYLVLGGGGLLSPLDFGGMLYALAAYAIWMVIATRPQTVGTVSATPAPDALPAAAAGE
jgi:hypothetical protein